MVGLEVVEARCKGAQGIGPTVELAPASDRHHANGQHTPAQPPPSLFSWAEFVANKITPQTPLQASVAVPASPSQDDRLPSRLTSVAQYTNESQAIDNPATRMPHDFIAYRSASYLNVSYETVGRLRRVGSKYWAEQHNGLSTTIFLTPSPAVTIPQPRTSQGSNIELPIAPLP